MINKLIHVLGLVLLCLSCPQCIAGENDASLPPDVSAGFAKARNLLTSSGFRHNTREFCDLVQKLAPYFALVPAMEQPATNHFFKVHLNRHKTGFDGIRFHVPTGPDRLLNSIMALPKAIRPVQWIYISDSQMLTGQMINASEGKNPSDDYFGALYDRYVPWGKDGDDYITLTQTGGKLKGGADGIICFSYARDADFTIQGAIKMSAYKPGVIDWDEIMDFKDE